MLPHALSLNAPVVIDVPVGHVTIPAAPWLQAIPDLPWTSPQEALIESLKKGSAKLSNF